MRILSIDAWREREGGWTWNNWFHVGDIPHTVDTLPQSNRAILKLMRDEGYLSDASKGRVAVEDDQYNLVILDRGTFEPIFAIEYGAE